MVEHSSSNERRSNSDNVCDADSRKKQYDEFSESLRNLEIDRIMGSAARHSGCDTQEALWGLALSGGGIRSATYCLGVLQALTKRGLLSAFHYCSTVSGGGYIGGYLQAMLHHQDLDATLTQLLPTSDQASARAQDTEAASAEPGTARTAQAAATAKAATPSSAISNSVLKLRSYSNFLSPNKRPLSGDRISIVSTYISNMLLTQTQLGALILFLAFLPPLLVIALERLASAPLLAWALAMICTVIALISRPREKIVERDNVSARPRVLFKGSSVVPPVGLALSFILLASLLWSGESARPLKLEVLGVFSRLTGFPLSAESSYFAVFAVASTYLLGFFTWLLWWWREASRRDRFGIRLAKQLVFGTAAMIAIGATAFVLVPASQVLQHTLYQSNQFAEIATRAAWLQPYLAIGLGAPALFAAFYFINLLHLSLAYTPGDAVSRERWTRLMGRCAIWLLCGLTLPLLLTVYIPALLYTSRHVADKSGLLLSTWALISSAGAAVGYWDRAALLTPGMFQVFKRVLLACALWVFIGGIVIIAGSAVVFLLDLSSESTGIDFRGFWGMAVATAIWLVLAYFIDENEFSMNGFYRNRLVRCYLAASRTNAVRDLETGLDPEGDDIKLSRLRKFRDVDEESERPLYPLLCGAVNLVRSRRLEWQDRKAASFVFSPLFCGHQPLPEGQTGPIGDRIELPVSRQRGHCLSPSKLASEQTLGAAMSVSGAAISPSMGYHSSSAVSVLLTLFNARLGWWVENHNAEPSAANFAGLNLLSELLSNMHENGKYAYVTDGGHFENLGIYELVRRHCRFILAVDATADHDRRFADLANAVHKCRVDFGAEIDIDTTLMQTNSKTTGHARRCAALGKITYKDGAQGVVLYLKPSLLGDESADIRNYANVHPQFPHQPTSDQFFDEIQFECYRQLGFQNMLSLFERDSTAPSHLDGRITLADVVLKEKFVKQITYRLYEPADATSVSRSHHGGELLRLLEKQRTVEGLACMDHQLYPGLLNIDPNAGGKAGAPLEMRLAPKEHFRDCFYFMQEVIQLMEGVYNDLELERNWNHPDNRGWINQFRHWSWTPMFRLVWSLTLQTRSSRFVHFCESRLDMSKIDGYLKIEWPTLQAGIDTDGPVNLSYELACHADQLYAQAQINFLEQSMLKSKAVRDALCDACDYKLGVLQFSRGSFLAAGAVEDSQIPNMSVGVVLLTRHEADRDGWTIVMLRVHDHLRKMGLGLAFMRAVVGKTTMPTRVRIHEVKIAPGHYGEIAGEVNRNAAAKHSKRLKRFLTQARLMENG
ncbi:patatin-like phospholipase family protein [Lysobacter sp. Root690]|uniref:patatin-like phospholipase family protein n=1 Tax=Lysobacter sp. Root690 TaxID=1736588 RepID=UPI0006F99720|nr:patatin-like phospholipase family protein [Lysobacter sp. Root690]KRB07746.1 hypothetical protein ASD86_07950 [Lysobacter sp. Root690]